MRRLLIVTAAVLVAVIFFVLLTLPARPLAIEWRGEPAVAKRTIAGAYHVHSTRSDGAGDRSAIAKAASRAGLKFVVFTDHGDATEQPEAPVYIHGVLCVDAVEISTSQGHYIAVDMPAAPYPLGGEAAAVVADVARLGGFGFVAHPDSLRRELRWSPHALPVAGLEWLNADSEWRDEGRLRLGRVLVDYLFRPGPALASVLNRPAGTLARWDAMTALRPVVGIGGHDAHGGIRSSEEGRLGGFLGLPSYEASFRSFSVRAVLDDTLSADAAADARLLIAAIRAGRIFTAIDGVAAPAVIDFRAERGNIQHFMGDMIPPGPARLVVHAAVPPGGHLVLLRNGEETRSVAGGDLQYDLPAAEGAYRIEVRQGADGTQQAPFVVTNPIYFMRPAAARPAAPAREVVAPRALTWHAEQDPGSRTSMSRDGSEVTLQFTLQAGERTSQFAALAADFLGQEAFSRIRFTGSASRPMRISVQLRYAASGGARWGTSVYMDKAETQNEVLIADMGAADGQTGSAADTVRATSLLFVVDLTNARPGDTGSFRLSNLSFGR